MGALARWYEEQMSHYEELEAFYLAQGRPDLADRCRQLQRQTWKKLIRKRAEIE